MSRYMLGLSLVGMITLTVWWSVPGPWLPEAHDIHVFEAPDRIGLAVVTPDPFSGEDPLTGLRRWQAEVHIRVGSISITEYLYFYARSIECDTITFIETAWGREVHCMAYDPGNIQRARYRWLAQADGLQPVGDTYAGVAYASVERRW